MSYEDIKQSIDNKVRKKLERIFITFFMTKLKVREASKRTQDWLKENLP